MKLNKSKGNIVVKNKSTSENILCKVYACDVIESRKNVVTLNLKYEMTTDYSIHNNSAGLHKDAHVPSVGTRMWDTCNEC